MNARIRISVSAVVALGVVAAAAADCGPGDDCEVTLTCPSSSSGQGGATTTSTGPGGSGGMTLGDPCLAPDECPSMFCVDGVCCDGQCDGTCEACNVDDAMGTCAPSPGGFDPDAECGAGVCDGSGACAEGNHIWSQTYGDASLQETHAIAVDSNGDIVVVGFFDGTIDFGGGPLSASGTDIMIAKLDPSGNELWAERYGDPGYQAGLAVTTDDARNIFVAGNFEGALDFPPIPLNPVGGFDAFLVKLSPSGDYRWIKRFGDASSPAPGVIGIATDAQGSVFCTFGYEGALDGNGKLQSAGGLDILVAKYAANGGLGWENRFGGTADEYSAAVAVDQSTGEVVVTGEFDGQLSFGAGALSAMGGTDVFVAKLDGNGSLRWARQYGGSGDERVRGVSIDEIGRVTVVGTFEGSIDFGGGAMSAIGRELYVATLDAGGNYAWATAVSGTTFPTTAAHDPSGNVLISGFLTSNADFGGGPLPFAGGQDIFLAKLSSSGSHLWSQSFGDAAFEQGHGVASDPAGNVLLVGAFQQSIDFGGGTRMGGANLSGAVAKFGP